MDETPDPASERDESWYRRLAIPIGLVVVTVACGTVGTYRYLASLPGYGAVPQRELLVESLFTAVGFLLVNSGPYPILDGATPLLVYVGRAAGLLFFAYAAILGFGALFADQLKPLRIKLWHYRDQFLPGDAADYVVVCGVGRKGFQLADRLLENGRHVTVIDVAEDNARTRELGDRGAVVLREDATRKRTVGRRARVDLAAELFVNCGDDQTNTEVVQTVADWLAEQDAATEGGQERLDCHVHIAARQQRYFIYDQLGEDPRLRLDTYDTATVTARVLLDRRPPGRLVANPEKERIHTAVFGWNDRSEALVIELCQRMHYLERYDRAITVVCRDPEAARAELFDSQPALDPEQWDEDSTRRFVERLFPDISFVELPANEDVILSDRFGLYGRLDPDDILTLIVADEDGFRSGVTVSTILPRLEALERERACDTAVHYFADVGDDDAMQAEPTSVQVESDVVTVRPFGEFVDRCTPSTVRGDTRDAMAKQLALFFHLRYDYDPRSAEATALDATLADSLPLDPPAEAGYEYETVSSYWAQSTLAERQPLAERVWHHLAETERDANRHAADHIPIKHRIASLLAADEGADETAEAIVERLALTEHRRWCAEKFLNGWEPLPVEHATAWREDDDAEASLRAQKYHLDLRAIDQLRALTEGEAEKDVSLVRFALEHLHREHERESKSESESR